jgi:hypothetical protein
MYVCCRVLGTITSPSAPQLLHSTNARMCAMLLRRRALHAQCQSSLLASRTEWVLLGVLLGTHVSKHVHWNDGMPASTPVCQHTHLCATNQPVPPCHRSCTAMLYCCFVLM